MTKRQTRDRKRHMKLVNWYGKLFSKHIPLTANQDGDGGCKFKEGDWIGLSRKRVGPDAHRQIRRY